MSRHGDPGIWLARRKKRGVQYVRGGEDTLPELNRVVSSWSVLMFYCVVNYLGSSLRLARVRRAMTRAKFYVSLLCDLQFALRQITQYSMLPPSARR